jgi:ankyrin repeat protein
MSSTLPWKQACRQGDEAQVKRLLPNQSDETISLGMEWAAEHNHLHLVLFLIEKGANDWNGALVGAARGGHLHLAQFFVDKGANRWNWALEYAAKEGHLHLVQFLVDKGANRWNWALEYAAGESHLPLVQLLIECGAIEWPRRCVLLLEQHPDTIIALFQRGKVPRKKFAQHSAAFEQQIVAFLEWQRQAKLQLYDTCLLPHELCALVVAY